MPLTRNTDDIHNDAIQTAYGIFKGGTVVTDDATENWTTIDAQQLLTKVSTARTTNRPRGQIEVFLKKNLETAVIPDIVSEAAERCGLHEHSREHWHDGTLKSVVFEHRT